MDNSPRPSYSEVGPAKDRVRIARKGAERVMGLRFYDFFAGAGLVELALNPEWTCVWANDIDPRKAAVYKENFSADQFHLGDVAEVEASALPDPPVDLAWASFPCQDLSLAGWRRGMSAQRSGTFWAFHRIMTDLNTVGKRPPLIVIENVVGLLYGGNFSGLCEALTALNMQVGALVIDADRFLPQSRPRVFIVAVDTSLDCQPWFDAWPENSPWFPRPLWSAWRSLPDSLRESWRWWKLPVPKSRLASVADVIEEQPQGVSWQSAEETERLLRLMSPANQRKVAREREQVGRSVGFLYKRTRKDGQRAEVRFDGVAGCLRTPYGGSSRQTVVIIDNGHVRSRLLSPRELARLMGVPNSFKLPAKYNDTYRAMGDGVAVPAVAWLSENLLTPLASASRGDLGKDADPRVPVREGQPDFNGQLVELNLH